MPTPDATGTPWEGVDPWASHRELQERLSESELATFDRWLDAARMRDLGNRRGKLVSRHPDLDINADLGSGEFAALNGSDLAEIVAYQDDEERVRSQRGEKGSSEPIIPPGLEDEARAHIDFDRYSDCPACHDYKAAVQFAVRRLVRLEAVDKQQRGPEHDSAIKAAERDLSETKRDWEACRLTLCGRRKRVEDPTPPVNLHEMILTGLPSEETLTWMRRDAIALRPTTMCPECDHICDHIGEVRAHIASLADNLALSSAERWRHYTDNFVNNKPPNQLNETSYTDMLEQILRSAERREEVLLELLARCERLRCPDPTDNFTQRPIPTPELDPGLAALAEPPVDDDDGAPAPESSRWWPRFLRPWLLVLVVIGLGGGVLWHVLSPGGPEVPLAVPTAQPDPAESLSEPPRAPPTPVVDGSEPDDPGLDRGRFLEEFRDSIVGQATEAGVEAYAGESDDLECVADVLYLSVGDLDDLAFLAQPDVSTWPSDLLDVYAEALETCHPLRPFYLEEFGQYSYIRGGCPEDMTDRVLAIYSWKFLLEEGILEPASAIAIQVIFDGFVLAGYEITGCFSAG